MFPPPSLLGIRRQGGIQLLTITSPQPGLLMSLGFSFFRSVLLLFPPQFVSVSRAPPAVFNPISALILCPASITFAYVMRNELLFSVCF